ncbi:MAG: type II toxin-antitoxin system VapC family toxin [Nitratireductor rhodophyticola]|uniref:type II toxin-antitoxin system VapC family toxin n=1 Tax=Nitratireductor rhodophyticola TaxID=2854036 RepID=UPI0032D979BF
MIGIDTHVLVWWANGDAEKLSAAAGAALGEALANGKIFISSITAWEIAMLVARGRLGLTEDVRHWLDIAAELNAVEFVPIDNEIAVLSTRIGDDFHRDPADRFIVATCQKFAVPLVTADEKIRRYPRIATIW